MFWIGLIWRVPVYFVISIALTAFFLVISASATALVALALAIVLVLLVLVSVIGIASLLFLSAGATLIAGFVFFIKSIKKESVTAFFHPEIVR